MNKNLSENAYEIANDLYEAGVIDSITLREYESLCIPPVQKMNARQIKKLRLHERLSQAVFAKCLNTTASTIRQWEQGKKHPRGTSLKLLNLVAQKGLIAIL